MPSNFKKIENEKIKEEAIVESTDQDNVEEDYFMEQTLAQERLRKTFKVAPQVDTPQMVRVKRSAELPQNRIYYTKK